MHGHRCRPRARHARIARSYCEQEAITNATTGQITYNMYYGSMSGGTQPYEFANITGTQLLLAGWTSL